MNPKGFSMVVYLIVIGVLSVLIPIGSYYTAKSFLSGNKTIGNPTQIKNLGGSPTPVASPAAITSENYIHQILGKTLAEAVAKLGKPDKVNITPTKPPVYVSIWEKEKYKLQGRRETNEGRFYELDILFNNQGDTSIKGIIKAGGVDVDPTKVIEEFNTTYWLYDKKYGQVTILGAGQSQNTKPIITIQSKDFISKDFIKGVSKLLNRAKTRGHNFISTNSQWILMDGENTSGAEEWTALGADPENYDYTPLYPLRLPPKDYNVRYRSDGNTLFEFSYPVDQKDDPECKEEGSVCTFSVRNGEVTSKKI